MASTPFPSPRIPSSSPYVQMARRREHARASPSPLAVACSLAAILCTFSVAGASAPAPAPALDAISAIPPAPHAASHSTFGYDGETAPDKWGTLRTEWAICGDGTKQSPIDITTVETQKEFLNLTHNYRVGVAILENRGHDFMLRWKDGNGKLLVQGKEYTLKQTHWHVPSEHTFNGTHFDAEMHMVHEDPSMARAVVSLLFTTKAGCPSKLLSNMEPYFKKLAAKENDQVEVKDPVDPTTWIDNAFSYYQYEGSLTTPPCTENVLWTIIKKVSHASQDQIEVLKSVTRPVEPNVRPTQKINDRVARYYKPEAIDEPVAKCGVEATI